MSNSTLYKFDENNFAVEDWAESLKYFDEQVIDTQKYWQRLGGRPDFAGKTVLEVGCGHGALCIDIARSGAKRVIGLDLIGSRIDFANWIVAQRYPNIADRLEFHKLDIADFPLDEPIDIVVSKDTFEHIMDLSSLLRSIDRVLSNDGLLISGYSPLYYSPYGDHGFHAIGKRFKFPWAHLILGEERVVAAYNDYHPGIHCRSIYELGLNKLKRRDFLNAYRQAGFEIIYEEVNATYRASKLMPILRLMRKFPGLEDYANVNMYVMLRPLADR